MNRLYGFAPAALRCVETDRPEQRTVDVGTVIVPLLWFDASTREYANGLFRVPADIDTAGTVTFRAFCLPRTGVASKNVGWTLEHTARATGESLDATYTAEDSAATSINSSTNGLTEVSWTETVANLGWAAGDLVPFRVSRNTSVANNQTSDVGLVHFEIQVPIA